jgi:hypothetical protein
MDRAAEIEAAKKDKSPYLNMNAGPWSTGAQAVGSATNPFTQASEFWGEGQGGRQPFRFADRPPLMMTQQEAQQQAAKKMMGYS